MEAVHEIRSSRNRTIHREGAHWGGFLRDDLLLRDEVNTRSPLAQTHRVEVDKRPGLGFHVTCPRISVPEDKQLHPRPSTGQ